MSLVAYLGIASGVALVLTGVGLGLARPRREGSWFFVAFVIAWGGETALFNSFPLVDSLSTVVFLERLALVLLLVQILFLVHFTVRFTRSMDTRHGWWSWGAAALTLAVGGAFAVDPSLFSDLSGRSLGTLLFITIPNFAALYVTVGILADRHASPRSEIEHREVRIILIGLMLYASYAAGFHLSLYWGLIATEGAVLDFQLLGGLFTLATVFLVGLAANRWRMDEAPDEWSPRERPMLLVALLGPFLVGLVTGIAQIVDLPRIDLMGLFRIGTALVIAYGLLKFEIFDIDRKVKTGIRGSVIVGTFVVAFFVVSEGIETLVSETVGNWAGLGAAGLLTIGLRPIERKANQLADQAMPEVDDSQAYTEDRKAEVYQAAVERAAGDEVLTDREKEILAGLREDLGLHDNEAREIEERVLSRPVAG